MTISYTERLDNALIRAAWAHNKAKQYRKGTDIPYIIHPAGAMMIASSVTEDEDVLIACLLHDTLEDVDSSIYSEDDMRLEFGDRVTNIVLDVTKNLESKDWYEVSRLYLEHLENEASDEAVIVSLADKIHNLLSILRDYDSVGDSLWSRFATKSGKDQLWWYRSVLEVGRRRSAPSGLTERLADMVATLESKIK